MKQKTTPPPPSKRKRNNKQTKIPKQQPKQNQEQFSYIIFTIADTHLDFPLHLLLK